MYKIVKSITLPSVTEPNTIYLVKSSNYFTIYITDNDNNLISMDLKSENNTKLPQLTDTHYSRRLKILIPALTNLGSGGDLNSYAMGLISTHSGYRMFDMYIITDGLGVYSDLATVHNFCNKAIGNGYRLLLHMPLNAYQLSITDITDRYFILLQNNNQYRHYSGLFIEVTNVQNDNIDNVIFCLKYLRTLTSQDYICPTIVYFRNNLLWDLVTLRNGFWNFDVCDGFMVYGTLSDFSSSTDHLKFLSMPSAFKAVAVSHITLNDVFYDNVIRDFMPQYILCCNQSTVDGTGNSTYLNHINLMNIRFDLNNVPSLMDTLAAKYQKTDTQLNPIYTDTTPVGSIIYYPRIASNGIPSGWLYCNGGQLSKSTYVELFSVIGYTFGGSGNTFYLPDLRGVFIRGYDDGRGLNPGRAFGSYQADMVGPHRHLINIKFRDGFDLSCGNDYLRVPRNDATQCNSNNFLGTYTTRPTDSYTYMYYTFENTTESETTVKNIALTPIIKYTSKVSGSNGKSIT